MLGAMRGPRAPACVEGGRPLDERDDVEAVTVLVDAFASCPSTGWIVAAAEPPPDAALAALSGSFLTARRRTPHQGSCTGLQGARSQW